MNETAPDRVTTDRIDPSLPLAEPFFKGRQLPSDMMRNAPEADTRPG